MRLEWAKYTVVLFGTSESGAKPLPVITKKLASFSSQAWLRFAPLHVFGATTFKFFKNLSNALR
jgi:hypothetical protein